MCSLFKYNYPILKKIGLNFNITTFLVGSSLLTKLPNLRCAFFLNNILTIKMQVPSMNKIIVFMFFRSFRIYYFTKDVLIRHRFDVRVVQESFFTLILCVFYLLTRLRNYTSKRTITDYTNKDKKKKKKQIIIIKISIDIME